MYDHSFPLHSKSPKRTKRGTSNAASQNLSICTWGNRHTTEHMEASRLSSNWTDYVCVPDALSITNEQSSMAFKRKLFSTFTGDLWWCTAWLTENNCIGARIESTEKYCISMQKRFEARKRTSEMSSGLPTSSSTILSPRVLSLIEYLILCRNQHYFWNWSGYVHVPHLEAFCFWSRLTPQNREGSRKKKHPNRPSRNLHQTVTCSVLSQCDLLQAIPTDSKSLSRAQERRGTKSLHCQNTSDHDIQHTQEEQTVLYKKQINFLYTVRFPWIKSSSAFSDRGVWWLLPCLAFQRTCIFPALRWLGFVGSF